MHAWAASPLGAALLIVATVVLFAVGWLLVTRLLGGPVDEMTIIQGAVIGLIFGVVEVLNLRHSKPPAGR